MSRLKPAFGGIAPAAGRQQAASKQQVAFEQDVGLLQEKAHLISRECVDASLQVSDQFHNTKNYSIKTIFQP